MTPLADAVRRAMTTSAGHLAVLETDTGRWNRYPWPEVHGRAEAIGAHVLDGGAGSVGLVGEPTADLVAAIQGTWLAGRAVSILPGPVRRADPQTWARATMARFAGVGVRTVYSHGTTLDLLARYSEAEPAPLRPAVFDVAAAGASGRSIGAGRTAEPGTPAVLQGTAGSTGTPRTARLSPAAVLANTTGLVEHIGVDPGDDVGCSWLPLYHDMGLTFLLSGAVSGTSVWLAPTTSFAASPFRWLQWLHDSRATLTAAPNFAYSVIGDYARRAPEVDLGRIRVAINGGEPVDCSALERFGSELAGRGFDAKAFMPSYGLAEATCAVTAPRPGTGLRYVERPGAGESGVEEPGGASARHAILGEPIPGMQVRVCEPGEPGRGGVGEIEIRGTSMMSGYFDDDEFAAGAWFPTGDLGYLADGGLVVCGRAKEVITVAGRNVFPGEVERVAETVRGVRKGAVVAVGTGDRVRPGLVIAAEFRGRDEAGARSELISAVAAACGVVPAKVELCAPGSLPRTSSGKLRRLAVKDQLAVGG